MALLKHRGITRASYDVLIAPDPNTEYTVLETDGTFTRYIGSKAIKDKTAARLDGDGNFDLGGKDIKNVNELTVAELTSLIDKIVVKKILELQADINFDGHKAIHPNIEDGVLESALDANSQEILNPILNGAKKSGSVPEEDDDIIDLKTARLLLTKISGFTPDGADLSIQLSSSTPQTFFYGSIQSAQSLSKNVFSFVRFYSTYFGPGSQLIVGTFSKDFQEPVTPENGYPINCKVIMITYAGYLYVYILDIDSDESSYGDYVFLKRIQIFNNLYAWGAGNDASVPIDYGTAAMINGGVQFEID